MGTAVLEALVMLGLVGRGCPQTPEQKTHGGESLAAAATAKKTSLVASEAAHRSCLFSGEEYFLEGCYLHAPNGVRAAETFV